MNLVDLAGTFGAPTVREYVEEVKPLLAEVGHMRVHDGLQARGCRTSCWKGFQFMIRLIASFSSGLEATPRGSVHRRDSWTQFSGNSCCAT